MFIWILNMGASWLVKELAGTRKATRLMPKSSSIPFSVYQVLKDAPDTIRTSSGNMKRLVSYH